MRAVRRWVPSTRIESAIGLAASMRLLTVALSLGLAVTLATGPLGCSRSQCDLQAQLCRVCVERYCQGAGLPTDLCACWRAGKTLSGHEPNDPNQRLCASQGAALAACDEERAAADITTLACSDVVARLTAALPGNFALAGVTEETDQGGSKPGTLPAPLAGLSSLSFLLSGAFASNVAGGVYELAAGATSRITVRLLDQSGKETAVLPLGVRALGATLDLVHEQSQDGQLKRTILHLAR